SMFRSNPVASERLRKRFEAPSMWDRFVKLLERRGFHVADESGQIAAIVAIYRSRSDHDLRMLCEAMIEYDEMFSLWREHHVRMAQRMIGSKAGTGEQLVESAYGKASPMGTIGVEYLAQTLNKKFF